MKYLERPIRRYAGLDAIGRILLGAIFLVSGISKATGWDQTVDYMASEGLPVAPLLILPAILIETLAGICLILGLKARAAAGLLFLFLIPTTLVFHDFWTMSGADFQMQMVQFLKNLAILGGLALVVANGAGALSIDGIIRDRKARKQTPVRTDRDRLRVAS